MGAMPPFTPAFSPLTAWQPRLLSRCAPRSPAIATAPARRAAAWPSARGGRHRPPPPPPPPTASYPPPFDTEEIRRRAEAAGARARAEGVARGDAARATASRSRERAVTALEVGLRSFLPSSAAALPSGARSLFFLGAVVAGGAVAASAALTAVAALAVATLTVVSLLLPVGLLLVPFSMLAAGVFSFFAGAAVKLGVAALLARGAWGLFAKAVGLSPPSAPASTGDSPAAGVSGVAPDGGDVGGGWAAELDSFDAKLRAATGVGGGGGRGGGGAPARRASATGRWCRWGRRCAPRGSAPTRGSLRRSAWMG
ncbi:hypothetical protein BU14_0178s0010 [Porphyra umbilicalis]|uniref:Uncharacterized protein n=1 Tax=Porphyra umbilicalis TaxID=2786 RepID=A0A1X6P764_PORUM|nr:hypothetical protein BU14_0178s0010 [Porphyra umbilicalis]|eukprot:OSX76694.1 hypothetical protein BU14_0178s0010 [Porphyra umbilicalis]